VLGQFTKHTSESDFADIRRSAGLKPMQEIRANDFLVAMLIRLGEVKISSAEVIKCREIFSHLDVDGTVRPFFFL
jgi:hypothetical protein